MGKEASLFFLYNFKKFQVFWAEGTLGRIPWSKRKSIIQKGEKREFYTFTHHTEYSLLDGSNKIREYIARVKELGMDSAAITDHGVMFGVVDFYKEAKAAGINPIIGCEVYVARIRVLTGKSEDQETTGIITLCCSQRITQDIKI